MGTHDQGGNAEEQQSNGAHCFWNEIGTDLRI